MTKTCSLFRLSLFSVLIGAAICLLVSPAIAEEYLSVAKDGVNIRSGPDTTKEILWTVFKGFPLQVTDHQGTWSKVVDYEGDTGWIASSLLTKEKTLIVKVETANIRVGAGIDYELVASAKHGVVFKPLETEGEWVKVQHADGTSGWVASRLLWPN